jgi:hypothetical protein
VGGIDEFTFDYKIGMLHLLRKSVGGIDEDNIPPTLKE